MSVENSGPDVYGQAFSMYRHDLEAFQRFIRFFDERFAANGLDPEALFRGKKCLDVGCGSGRGSFFMCAHGAESVVGIDYSHKNIETCQLFAAEMKVPNATFFQGDAHELPFEDESFDFVWCNGVLHHMRDTNKGLAQCARVLRTGGGFWLYLYGTGGIEWAVVDFIRDKVLDGVDYDDAFRTLLLLESHKGSMSEFLDNWYTPYLRRYTHADVMRRLVSLGFEAAPRLTGDCGQRAIDPSLAPLLGEQDLRYCLIKAKPGQHGDASDQLPDVDGIGSAYNNSPQVCELIGRCEASLLPPLEAEGGRNLEKATLLRIVVAWHLNAVVLAELEKGLAFNFEAVAAVVNRLAGALCPARG